MARHAKKPPIASVIHPPHPAENSPTPSARLSPARALALARLHRAKRGVRQNVNPGRQRTLKAVATLLRRHPVPGLVSRRALAAHCQVSDRTLRRWLAGEDWPPRAQLDRLAELTRRLDQRFAGKN